MHGAFKGMINHAPPRGILVIATGHQWSAEGGRPLQEAQLHSFCSFKA
jgi:hypothetical protein